MHNTKKKILLYGLVVCIVIIYWSALGVFSNTPAKTAVPQPTASELIPLTLAPIPLLQNEEVRDGAGAAIATNVEIIVGDHSYPVTTSGTTTLYDTMRSLADTGTVTLHAIAYPGLGQFIDSINDVKNTGDTYWVYYINGISASVGASNYIVKPGDVIEWKFEKAKL